MSIDLSTSRLLWTGMASHLIGDCFDLAKPYIDQDYNGLDPHVRFVSTQLFIDCHLSSESVLLLVRAGKEWDAEIVARSVVEGTLKYCYMLEGTESEREQRATEFWDTLPSYVAARRSDRAQDILDNVADPESACWRPIREIVLTDEEIAQMRGGTNRQTRKELEEKWSFSGIVRHFATSNSPQWKSVSMLSHGYGNSSHLIHKDGDGVGMVWDRCRRDSHRQTAVTLAHAARLVSDICAFSQLRVHTLLRACRSSTNAVAEIAEKYVCLSDELRNANEWFTSVEYQ